jgi:hypothetical protein
MNIKKILIGASAAAVMFGSLAVPAFAAKGFDDLGYNDRARVFQGAADGIDGVLDQKVWGDSTYANDHLVMKWNAEWDRGNDEGWTNGPYNAWNDNEWNGQGPGGSGEIWHYKFVWVGDYVTDPTLVPEGGYGIWGQFAVIQSQGTFENAHFWDTLATPGGYGAYFSH